MKRYPLKLSYIPKTAIWGGTRLAREWGKQSADKAIAETWELSVRSREMAMIQNGDAKGLSLAEYFSVCGADCVSPEYRLEDRFPLLIKFIDAEDRLSVQVHPDDDYASRVEHDSGKTEMWYIVDADEGASIVYDLCDGVDRAAFSQAVRDKKTDTVLRFCPVTPGESYFIPAGMVHAIGKGILIAEIQQNSDLTYRIYDYERRQPDGTLRVLHTEKAMDVVRSFTKEEVDAIRFSNGKTDETTLANSAYFRVHRYAVGSSDETWHGCVGAESFAALLCIAGEGYILYEGEKYPMQKGDSYFLPAGMGDYAVSGELSWLTSEI